MKNTFKLKDNLFMIGNDIISYETHVATIEENKSLNMVSIPKQLLNT